MERNYLGTIIYACCIIGIAIIRIHGRGKEIQPIARKWGKYVGKQPFSKAHCFSSHEGNEIVRKDHFQGHNIVLRYRRE
jgi:hypothetical protein